MAPKNMTRSVPKSAPVNVPISPKKKDSAATVKTIWPGLVPKASMMPNSRVLSSTAISMVLSMPVATTSKTIKRMRFVNTASNWSHWYTWGEISFQFRTSNFAWSIFAFKILVAASTSLREPVFTAISDTLPFNTRRLCAAFSVIMARPLSISSAPVSIMPATS